MTEFKETELDEYASAIVVPAAGNMLHALERAREDKLGKAVVLTASSGRHGRAYAA